jgi:hypothetical protein
MQSEQIGELAGALAKAQAEIAAPKKGRTAQIRSEKGAYSYHYADLADVIECYRAPLSKHGLALAQATRVENGHIVLTTKLLHSSGQWLDSEYPITIFNRPQEQGSAITYARRYAVTALLGIAAEDDDDGAAAQEGTPKQAKAAPKPEPVKPSALTQTEIESVHSLAKKAGYKSTAELAPILHNICGVSKASELSKNELPAVLEALGAMAAQKVPA